MKRLWLGLVVLLLCGCHTAQPEPSHIHPTTRVEITPLRVGHAHTLRLKAIVPRHFTVGNIGAHVVPINPTGHELVPPSDPTMLGWWGRKLGAPHGTTLLVGHTVHKAAWKTYGQGALDNLEDISVGTDVNVSGRQYVVKKNSVISKTRLAAQAKSLFSQTGKPRLVVITCENYHANTGEYSSNVVMIATPKED